jgi:hypothetical protein
MFPEGESDEDQPFPTVPGYSSNANRRASQHTDLERDLYPNEDPLQRAKRLLKDSVDGAAATIIEIALHGSTEKLRMDAAKTILDRVMGPASMAVPTDDDGPLERMFRELDLAANGDASE